MKKFLFNTAIDYHSILHFCVSMTGVVAFGLFVEPIEAFGIMLAIGFLWEVLDALKPNWKEGLEKPKIIQMLFYSDGFGLMDLVFDVLGSSLGLIIIQYVGGLK